MSARTALAVLLMLPLCLGSGCVTEGPSAQGDDDAAPERVGLAMQRHALTTWCGSAKACDDGDLCTSDHCLGGVCSHAPIDGCCNQQSDCDDGLPCTIDTCDLGFHACQYKNVSGPSCCTKWQDCFPLTKDICGKPVCINTKCLVLPVTDCCTSEKQCDDGLVTTQDSCEANSCVHKPLQGYCKDNVDAITACDDNNACTIDYCLNNTCRHTLPKNGCCATDADCNDGNKATDDTCMNVIAYKGTCSHTIGDGCGCKNGFDCNDNNPCTFDSCEACLCKNLANKGCCQDKYDCDDGNPASADYCVFNICQHVTPPGQCSPKTAALDCAAFWPVGYTGSCWPHPDGKSWCSLLPFGPGDLP